MEYGSPLLAGSVGTVTVMRGLVMFLAVFAIRRPAVFLALSKVRQ
jgi:hypothetical protein